MRETQHTPGGANEANDKARLLDAKAELELAQIIRNDGASSVLRRLARVAELRSIVAEFLSDAETLNEPFRNEAICERARAALARKE